MFVRDSMFVIKNQELHDVGSETHDVATYEQLLLDTL